MVITYEFVDGTKSEVEVSEELGNFIVEDRRREASAERKHRRHTLSTDALLYEGLEYGCTDNYEGEEENYLRKPVQEGLDKLTAVQKRRLFMYRKGMTLQQIAAVEGVKFQAIHQSINEVRKVFEKVPGAH